MKRYVVGDIHGGYRALKQVIERSDIDPEKDQLICLGDVADGWSEVPQCFEELLKFKNLVYVIGNHDRWLLNWFKTREVPMIWATQGGDASIKAYMNMINQEMEDRHRELLESAVPYHIEDNMIFIHGGFNHHEPIQDQSIRNIVWDRDLYYNHKIWEGSGYPINTTELDKYSKIFIGHTSTAHDRKDLTPVNIGKLWNLDQGAGWEGKLTIMNIDTEEYWQSDIVKTLYPEEKGR